MALTRRLLIESDLELPLVEVKVGVLMRVLGQMEVLMEWKGLEEVRKGERGREGRRGGTCVKDGSKWHSRNRCCGRSSPANGPSLFEPEATALI